MSVLIKGEKMPRCCNDCAFHKKETIIESVENGGDYVTYKNIVRCEICGAEDPYMTYRDADTKRRDDCPLVELLPHGRLIDISKMKIKANGCKVATVTPELLEEWLDAQPTVIESEE